MWSNALQVATINGIGDFILFLGKVIFNSIVFLILIYVLFPVGCICCLWPDLNIITQKSRGCSFLYHSMLVYCYICIFHCSYSFVTFRGEDNDYTIFDGNFILSSFLDCCGHSIPMRI